MTLHHKLMLAFSIASLSSMGYILSVMTSPCPSSAEGRQNTPEVKRMTCDTHNIHWLGHDSFRITTATGKVIYIDPYRLAGGAAADIVLVTHDHHDHLDPPSISRIAKPTTTCVTVAAGASRLTGNVKTVRAGDRLTIEGVVIEAVPAYNVAADRLKFHPKLKGYIGFILTVDGARIYHAGDTDAIAEMTTMNVDVALLPVSGTYVMTAGEAAGAAERIRPRVAIPMHYGAGVAGTDQDAAEFARLLKGKVEVRILEKE